MGRREPALFNRVALLSLGLCGVALVLWALSFQADSRLSVSTFSTRYTLHFSRGTIIFFGPPTEGTIDPAARELARLMNNDDFTWGPVVERWHQWVVEGDARPNSASSEMFRRFSDRLLSGANGLEPAERVWLKALDDPNKLVPAHMMLCFLVDRWHEARLRGGDRRFPYIAMQVEPAAKSPDLSRWKQIRQEWHERLDVENGRVHYGWLVAATLVLPVARMLRPVMRKARIGRWAFNAAAIVSLLFWIAFMVGWVWSYRAGMDCELPPKTRPPLPMPTGLVGANYAWTSYRWIGSSRGRIEFLERTLDSRNRASDGKASRAGYWILNTQSPSAGRGRYVLAPGGWLASSVKYYSNPAQIRPVGPGRGPTSRPPFIQFVPASPAAAPTRSAAIIAASTTQPASRIELHNGQSVTPSLGGARGAAPGVFSAARVSPTTRISLNAREYVLAFTQLRTTPLFAAGVRVLVISWWIPVLATSILPAYWALRYGLRRRFTRDGQPLCLHCGYDLRATLERCPECGFVPSPSSVRPPKVC
jgi:hypothetical protein